MSLLSLLMLFQAADPASAGQSPPVAADPAMAEATANRARVKTAAKFIEGPPAELPPEAKAEGAQGVTVVSGIVGTDGRFTKLTIRRSSKSKSLDDAALSAAAASRFDPARDETGQPIPIVASMPFEFSNTKVKGGGGLGIMRYRCDQYLRDTEWWARNWEGKEQEVISLMRGYSIMVRASGLRGETTARYAAAMKDNDFDDRLKAATESCRADPEKLLMDFMPPERELFGGMATRMKKR